MAMLTVWYHSEEKIPSETDVAPKASGWWDGLEISGRGYAKSTFGAKKQHHYKTKRKVTSVLICIRKAWYVSASDDADPKPMEFPSLGSCPEKLSTELPIGLGEKNVFVTEMTIYDLNWVLFHFFGPELL